MKASTFIGFFNLRKDREPIASQKCIDYQIINSAKLKWLASG